MDVAPGVAKFVWALLNPANLLVAMLLLGAVLLATRFRRLGGTLLVSGALAAAVIAYTPVADWLIEPLESRFASAASSDGAIAGIIVLGGAIDTAATRRRGQIALNGRGERLTAFVELAQRYPRAKLVYSGGAGESDVEADSEAAIAKPLLTAMGIAPERLTLEMRSRDTHENARFTYAMVKPAVGERWLLVTSAVHMPRSMGTFRRVGWNVIAYPVDYRGGARSEDTGSGNLAHGLTLLNAAAREWLGLLQYYAAGRMDRLLPE